MKYRILGKTNLRVSEVSFGGIPIQKCDKDDCLSLFDLLIERGVNFIDSARAYTVSEEYIGYAISGRREKFILATKSASRDYESMKRDILISLSNFNTNYIDLYQMHNVKENEDVSGALRALREAKENGLIGHIGITSHSLASIKKYLDCDDIETIQFPYNFLEQDAFDVFKEAYEKNIGVIVMKPLAGGVIDKASISLKFILSCDYVSVCIPGMASAKEVLENTGIDSYDLSNDDKRYIEDLILKIDKDFCHRCAYCLPCSVGIDIPSCFMFYGYYERYGLENWAMARYNALKVKASECIECGLCEQRCPYNLKIIDKLKLISKVMEK